MRPPGRIAPTGGQALSPMTAAASEPEDNNGGISEMDEKDTPPQSAGLGTALRARRNTVDHPDPSALLRGTLQGDARPLSPPGRTVGRITRGLLLGTALAILLAHGAAADLVGYKAIRAVVADKSDRVLIEANPVLDHLARERPEALREILRRLRAPLVSRRHGVKRPAPAPETESGALAENPDLAELYRESPEAALDLLRLIREAAKKK